MGLFCEVARALPRVFEHPLGYVVFAEGCLQEKVSERAAKRERIEKS